MELGSSPTDLEVEVAPPIEKPLKGWLTALNSVLSRLAMWFACLCLAGLLSVVVYGVILRYIFNNAPPYVEQVAKSARRAFKNACGTPSRSRAGASRAGTSRSSGPPALPATCGSTRRVGFSRSPSPRRGW